MPAAWIDDMYHRTVSDGVTSGTGGSDLFG